MRKQVFLLFMLCFCSCEKEIHPIEIRSTIHGRIIDSESREPVEDATVHITSQDLIEEYYTSSNIWDNGWGSFSVEVLVGDCLPSLRFRISKAMYRDTVFILDSIKPGQFIHIGDIKILKLYGK